MVPTRAEVARALAAGHLPGELHVASLPHPLRVRHATDEEGRPLLLALDSGRLALAMEPGDAAGDGAGDVAVALRVDDSPPVSGSPSYGRVWVAGWAAPLDADEQRAAALAFAGTRPIGDLLDVGHGCTLYRVETAEVRIDHEDHALVVDPAEYAAAEPDPVWAEEPELLADLVDHHPDILEGLLRRVRQAVPAAPVARPVRLDRYGVTCAIDSSAESDLVRLGFASPVERVAELADLLHPLVCARCCQS